IPIKESFGPDMLIPVVGSPAVSSLSRLIESSISCHWSGNDRFPSFTLVTYGIEFLTLLSWLQHGPVPERRRCEPYWPQTEIAHKRIHSWSTERCTWIPTQKHPNILSSNFPIYHRRIRLNH